jgi:heme exporter protein D
MRKQRGITSGWLVLIGLVVMLGLIAESVQQVKSYLDDVDARADARGYQRAKGEYEAALSAQKAEAARQLAAANAEVLAEIAHRENVRNELEAENAKLMARIDTQTAVNLGLVRAAGGLRDPGRTPGRGPGSHGTEGAATDAAGNGDCSAGRARLSDEAAQFLLDLTAGADKVVEQFLTCQKWANDFGRGRP